MRPRRPDEEHRAATPLELLFDLCFVVAVASAAAELHHAVSEDHAATGVVGYLAVFFAIWWAWMNFTWFASAFDTDDGVYRLTTLLQMAGVLVLAAGVPAVAQDADFRIVTLGYVVMRLAMVGQWLRASASAREFREPALRYAALVTALQVLWVLRLLLPEALLWPAFLVLVAAELAVPAIAERRLVTPWHPEHIAERYGLFTLIVLGEVILGATNAVTEAFTEEAAELVPLGSLAAAGLVVVFALWWLYFDEPREDLLAGRRLPLHWGYGHYAVFAATAAVGSGLEVAIDVETGAFAGSEIAADLAVPLPVAVFLLVVWALHVRHRGDHYGPAAQAGFPVAAVLVLATAFLGASVHLTAAVLAGLVTVVQVAKNRVAAHR
jgi:low temperature requirement protein LtrA